LPPSLASLIEELFDHPPEKYSDDDRHTFQRLKDGLNSGEIRAAEPDDRTKTGWRVNAWVKKGILLGFRMGSIVEMGPYPSAQPFLDKSTYPLKTIHGDEGVRLVPGGSSVRDGSFVGRGVVCMPPMFINVGAYVGEGTMVDSHALVGSCAQVGQSCHISAAAQIGGVIEPVGAMPVIVEDEVMIGGNCGVYEGTWVRAGAVLGAGTILTRSTPIYDIVRGDVYRSSADKPLEVPENAVVVPGSRPMNKGYAAHWDLSLYTPVIVKYRDDKTDRSIELEDLLR